MTKRDDWYRKHQPKKRPRKVDPDRTEFDRLDEGFFMLRFDDHSAEKRLRRNEDSDNEQLWDDAA